MSPDEPVPTGPVEMALIGFPGNRFDGSIIPALAELVDTGTVRVIDLVVVKKDADGNVTAAELSQLDDDEAATFEALDGEIGELFSDEDLAAAGEQLPPDSAAALLLWENSWATRLAAEVAGAGGVLLLHDRVPADAVRDALAAQPAG
ncbi:MAG TPA: DUF6325 family protein [Acidimicrobiales bacterium]|jgi:hypothetical protein|nr:DUF6325 family protein [Acidimicrobiales bacterium]